MVLNPYWRESRQCIKTYRKDPIKSKIYNYKKTNVFNDQSTYITKTLIKQCSVKDKPFVLSLHALLGSYVAFLGTMFIYINIPLPLSKWHAYIIFHFKVVDASMHGCHLPHSMHATTELAISLQKQGIMRAIVIAIIYFRGVKANMKYI